MQKKHKKNNGETEKVNSFIDRWNQDELLPEWKGVKGMEKERKQLTS